MDQIETTANEFLLTNRAALALAVFLYRRDAKVDVREMEKAFGNPAEVQNQLRGLANHLLISVAGSGRNLQPRAQLTESGLQLVALILIAAQQRREKMFDGMDMVNVASSGGVRITKISFDDSDMTIELPTDTAVNEAQTVNESHYGEQASFKVELLEKAPVAPTSVAGTKVYTIDVANAGTLDLAPIEFAEPIPVAAGVVIRVVCTPSAATAMTWRANFGGYEK